MSVVNVVVQGTKDLLNLRLKECLLREISSFKKQHMVLARHAFTLRHVYLSHEQTSGKPGGGICGSGRKCFSPQMPCDPVITAAWKVKGITRR